MSKYIDINKMEEIPKKKKHPVLIAALIITAFVVSILVLSIIVFKIDMIQFVKDLFDSRDTATSISIQFDEYEMGIGQTMDIKVGMTPQKTKTKYTLSSSDESIVSIDEESNSLKANKKGECEITARTNNGLEAETKVKVLDAPTSLTIEADDILFINDALRIKTETNKGESNGSVVFRCNDNARAKVSEDGIVTPILTGEVTITATTYNGLSAEKKIKIYKPVTKLILNQTRAILNKDGELELTYSFEKNEYSGSVTFSSDDTSVATVNDKGLVRAKKEGKAIIKARSDNNVTSSCEVIVASYSPNIRKNLDRTKPMVALTFDDGPSRANTESILETLDKYKGKGTFFVIGNKVGDNSDLIRTIYENGHEIGNHSWDHEYANDLNEKEQQNEIAKTCEAVYEVLGTLPSVFRCPGGIDSDYYREHAGAPIISWSIDTKDWETQSSKSTYERITSVFDRHLNLDGDIVLMHDIVDSTPEAVKKICALLNKRGYQLVTVSELAYYRGVDMNDGETYSCFYPDKPNTEITEPTKETKETEAADKKKKTAETEEYED